MKNIWDKLTIGEMEGKIIAIDGSSENIVGELPKHCHIIYTLQKKDNKKMNFFYWVLKKEDQTPLKIGQDVRVRYGRRFFLTLLPEHSPEPTIYRKASRFREIHEYKILGEEK